MATYALQIAGLVLGGVGMVGTVAVTIMPQWRVSAFIGSNIVVFENLWEGLWMNCMRHANIRMQCKIYDSLLALSPDLQASRGLMCAASVLSFLAFMTAVLGMKCTRCTGDDEKVKGYILLTAGVVFIVTGLVVLIPVSWVANSIIRDFYNPIVDIAQKRELGEALYIGWTTALVLIAGGALFCCVSCCNEKSSSYRYSIPSHRTTQKSYHMEKKSPSVYSKSQYV
ncbi:claudin-8 [Neophocaena asiaeorientalis asiaeorientalis]|uniref:Claudin n=3 Tax=Odontoceti TaxID=9722 RepID=A0A341C1E4_NEOAA|nr:claudin-8 [Delphinapterus leucas]XP_024608675.1 claudin-8 [Neophocaena asiaeorientalis asiaeorientalis]XP_032486450.1 claudin-8 [Phocoena sinus]